MKWKAPEEFDRYQWHKWFAWYPVKVGEAVVWLETVECRRVPAMVGTGDMDGVEYRKQQEKK